MMRGWQSVVGGAAGVAVVAGLLLPANWERVKLGDNDFQAFYVSGRLVLHRQLYNASAFQAAERAILGHSNTNLLATRPPFFAVAFWPLAQLPYRVAWPLWEGILLTAVAGFIWLWPDRRAAAVACCWSGGLVSALANGQDLPLILLWLAVALRFRARRPFLAGMVLALCAAKFHLFVFLPLLLWRHRLWRGFAAGAAGLVAISFAAGGWNWPREYAAALALGGVNPRVDVMPNLHGLVGALPYASAWEIASALLVAAGVLQVVGRTDFPTGLGAVLVGGLLVSRHAYLQDCALLLPVLLMALPAARGWSVGAVLWLLAPASGLALLAGHPAGDITRLAILALLCSAVAAAIRRKCYPAREKEAAEPPSQPQPEAA
jgi:hypothetical protein